MKALISLLQLCWDKKGLTAGSVAGLVLALMAWVIMAQHTEIRTLRDNYADSQKTTSDFMFQLVTTMVIADEDQRNDLILALVDDYRTGGTSNVLDRFKGEEPVTVVETALSDMVEEAIPLAAAPAAALLAEPVSRSYDPTSGTVLPSRVISVPDDVTSSYMQEQKQIDKIRKR